MEGQHFRCENHPAGDATSEGNARPDTDQRNVTVRLELGLVLLFKTAEGTSCISFTEMVYHNKF